MNTHHIRKYIRILCYLIFTIFFSRTAIGQSVKRYYGVIIEKDLSEFISKAVIPYADYQLDLSKTRSGVKTALFLKRLSESSSDYENFFLPCNYQASNYGQTYMITLTTTRHIKECPLWWFDSENYADIDGTKVFIEKKTSDVIVKRSPSLSVYKLRKPELYYEYDPEMVSVYKVDGTYRFHANHNLLGLLEEDYRWKDLKEPSNNDTIKARVVNITKGFGRFLKKYRDKRFAYRIDPDSVQSVKVTMIPKHWSAFFDYTDYFLVDSSNLLDNPGKETPIMFIHKSLIPALGMLTDNIYHISVPHNVPSFVHYMDLPFFILSTDGDL